MAVDRRGRAQILNLADGSVLGTSDFGVQPDLGRYDENGDTARFVVVGDRLYVTRRDGSSTSLTAYRLPDLRRIWHSTTLPFGWALGCASHLCVTTPTGMTAVDATTGLPSWSTTEWRLGLDSRTVGIGGPPQVFVSDAGHRMRSALLDPGTGRLVADLGGTFLRGPVLLRVDREQLGRTWVQAIDARGEVRTVGSLDGETLDECESVEGYVACKTRRGRVNVWQVP